MPSRALVTHSLVILLVTGCSQARTETESSPAAPTEVRATKATPPDEEVHGELVTIEGQRVLRVWGTPSQMGHAHGALLREEILEVVEGYALDVIPPATLDAAGPLYTSVAHIPPRLREEAEGIVAGMKSAGGVHVERLGRDLKTADLLVLNAMTDLLAIGCSSVSAWGAATEGTASLAGAPIIVRNLDWSEDPQLLANQVIIVYRPEAADRQPVVSVAFAGYIGCLSCMNEAGVIALFNMGYGEGAASPVEALGGFAPANLLLRDALERNDIDGDGHTTSDDIEAAWREEQHAGSYILHLLEPRREGVEAPARVLEVEADGVVARHPGGEVLGEHLMAATNHLRRKTEPRSCSRYERIEQRADALKRRFERDELWELGRDLRLPQVVYSLLVEPESRRLAVWLRRPGQAAEARAEPVTHPWAVLVGDLDHP